MDMFGFAGKRVLVTGASSGIGLDAARAFLEQGANVALLARDPAKLEAALAGHNPSPAAAAAAAGAPPSDPSAPPPTPLGTAAHSVVGDLSAPETLAASVKEAIEALGGLDVLVVSGGNGKSEYLGTDPDDLASYEFLNRVHVQATLALVQASEAALLESGGNVVVVSSLASDIAWPQTMPYNAAKAAQHCLLRNLALKYVKHGVRVNAVLPACIHTDALDIMAAKKGVDASVYAAKRARAHPMRRCGATREVTSAVLFLASNHMAGFIAGHFLNVDGGLSLTNWFNTTEMLTVGPEDAAQT